jgi:hypothetical protein
MTIPGKGAGCSIQEKVGGVLVDWRVNTPLASARDGSSSKAPAAASTMASLRIPDLVKKLIGNLLSLHPH